MRSLFRSPAILPYIFPALLLLVLLLQSCSKAPVIAPDPHQTDSTRTDTVRTDTVVTYLKGAVFIYSVEGTPIVSTNGLMKRTVTSDGPLANGERAIGYADSNGGYGSPYPLIQRSNGNISVTLYFPYDVDIWSLPTTIITLPAGTLEERIDTSRTGAQASHYPAAVVRVIRTTYLGRDTVTVGSEHLACLHLRSVTQLYYNVGFPDFPPYPDLKNAPIQKTLQVDYWYSTRLGFIVKDQQFRMGSGSAPGQESQTRTLISYKL